MTKLQLEEQAAQIAGLVKPAEGEDLADAVARALAATGETPTIELPAFVPDVDPASVPDNNPGDPRPDFDPVLGWRTPEVISWANRRANQAGGNA
jgi:hypothetical protein